MMWPFRPSLSSPRGASTRGAGGLLKAQRQTPDGFNPGQSGKPFWQSTIVIQAYAEIERIPPHDVRRLLANAMLSRKLDPTKIKLTAEAMAGIIKLIGEQGLHA